MLAGLLMLSLPFGFLALGITVAMDFSLWVTLMAYPATSGLLLLTLALLTCESTRRAALRGEALAKRPSLG